MIKFNTKKEQRNTGLFQEEDEGMVFGRINQRELQFHTKKQDYPYQKGRGVMKSLIQFQVEMENNRITSAMAQSVNPYKDMRNHAPPQESNYSRSVPPKNSYTLPKLPTAHVYSHQSSKALSPLQKYHL